MLGLFIVRYLISVSKHIPDLFSIVVHELKHVEGMLNPCESSHGFKKVAIVGMGGSEKTALAWTVFHNWQAQDSLSPAIWISLAEALTGDLDFEQIVMEMLMQCTGETFEKDVSLEELLFVLCSW